MSRLENYLRTYRKRAGLSQDEVAFLLGCRSGAKVSRYERLARQPNIRTLFACEIIFRVPARELFAGLYQKVEKVTFDRAQKLSKSLGPAQADRIMARKLTTLSALAAGAPTEAH